MISVKQCPKRKDKFPSRQEGEWKFRDELEDKRAFFFLGERLKCQRTKRIVSEFTEGGGSKLAGRHIQSFVGLEAGRRLDTWRSGLQ